MEVSDCFDFCTSTPCGCFPFKLLNIGAGFGDENLISRGGAMRAFAGTCVAAGWLVAGMRICVHSILSEESDVCVAGIISKLSSLSAGGMVGMSYLLR